MDNLLDIPKPDAPFAAQMRHRLAAYIAQGFPVDPNAEASSHPVWKDHSRVGQMLRNPDADFTVIAVHTVTDAQWDEFRDTYTGNSEHYGIVGEVVTADGWTGRYCYERPFNELIQELLTEAVLDGKD